MVNNARIKGFVPAWPKALATLPNWVRCARRTSSVTLHSIGVCVTLRAHGGFEWKHSSSQQLNACATIHGAL